MKRLGLGASEVDWTITFGLVVKSFRPFQLVLVRSEAMRGATAASRMVLGVAQCLMSEVPL